MPLSIILAAKGEEADKRPELLKFEKKIKRNVTACALVIYIFLAWTFNFFNPFYHPEDYNRDSWIRADAEKRGRMIHSFLRQHSLVGMTAEEVQNLLGPPGSSFRNAHNVLI